MKIYTKKIAWFTSSVLVFVCVIVVWKIESVFGDQSFRRNGEVLNVGWIWSVPYDISNTLRAPLAGPLSLIYTAGLSVVMFFGLIVSPVYYLFGTPVRKYHVHDAIASFPDSKVSKKRQSRSFWLDSPFELSNFNHFNETIGSLSRASETFAGVNEDEEAGQNNNEVYPNFVDRIFLFLDVDDENCKKLLICHSHGFLTFVPLYFLPIYKFFSRKMMLIPRDYQMAIQIGFEDQGNCVKTFENCTKDLEEIFQETMFSLLFPVQMSDGGSAGDDDQ